MPNSPPKALDSRTRDGLLEVAYAHFGFRVPESRLRSFELSVHTASRELLDCEPATLLARLAHGDPEAEAAFAEALVVLETYFFREPRHFDLVRELLAESTARRPLYVWSAGCASGEEPYSVAILAWELFGARAADHVRIHATDLSQDALRKAQAALYREWSFRGTSPELKERYFTVEPGGYRLREEVRSLVRFEALNLLHLLRRPSLAPRGIDLVFCRNVLLYFDHERATEVAACFRDALRPEGWLLTAPADPWVRPKGLAIDTSRGFFAYRRRDESTEGSALGTSTAPELPLPAPRARPPRRAAPPARPRPPKSSPSSARDGSRDWLSEAWALADRDPREALARLDDSEERSLDPEVHILRALLHQSLGEHPAVLIETQRALLLDRSLAFAHLVAAGSHLLLQHFAEARRALNAARRLVRDLDEGALVHARTGVTTGELLSTSAQLERALIRAVKKAR